METAIQLPIEKENVKKVVKKRDFKVQAQINHWSHARLEDFAKDYGVGNNTAAGIIINLFFKKMEAGKILP